MITDAYTLSAEEVLTRLHVDSKTGLPSAEAEQRLLQYGQNRLQESQPVKAWVIFFRQFLDPVIYVLGGATLLAFLFNELLEGFAVLIVILITALIGFFMEWQAIRSVEALQKMVETYASLIRDGQERHMNLHYVVPGDILILRAGDVVPADARLLEVESLAIKEAALTGESAQVEKKISPVDPNTPLAERSNMVYKGTIVSRGSGKAVVTATGDSTVIGEISGLTRTAKKGSTPLEKKLSRLSHRLIWLTIGLTVIITLMGYFQGKDFLLMIKTGIALAVAAIPEGLPIVATIALARGMLKLSHRNVVIKKLEAVETLGSTGIICTDKTGTLTENKMAVHNVLLAGRDIMRKDWEASNGIKDLMQDEAFKQLLKVAVLCNNAQWKEDTFTGDPVEVGLLNFSRNLQFKHEHVLKEYRRVREIPFDAEIKKMATLHAYQNKYFIAVKGALENLLGSCEDILQADGSKLPFSDKEHWIQRAGECAASGMRILAFAYKETGNLPSEHEVFEHLTFIGVTAFLDPPRKDIPAAINTYRNAGIKVVMITGDHPDTAKKIGEEIGLLTPEDSLQEVIYGGNLPQPEQWSAELEDKMLQTNIFARMAPKQKLDLVHLYQKNNQVVGMLGDGVNDAPALKKADIGIAMGIRGTEAAKEVADVILLDDKFTSTELAIRQGRTIFGNIRQFVIFLLSCNLAEIISVASASIGNLPMPLLPLQILFLNLVTDVFPALALGFGRGDKRVMEEPPRNPKESILTPFLWISTLVYGLTITFAVIAVTIYAWHFKNYSAEVVNNMAFYTLILGQLLNVFNLPKRQRSFFINEVTTNPWIWWALLFTFGIVIGVYHIPVMTKVLNLVPMNSEQLLSIFLFSISGLIFTQLLKRMGLTQ